jgi:hypothetical protein
MNEGRRSIAVRIRPLLLCTVRSHAGEHAPEIKTANCTAQALSSGRPAAFRMIPPTGTNEYIA